MWFRFRILKIHFNTLNFVGSAFPFSSWTSNYNIYESECRLSEETVSIEIKFKKKIFFSANPSDPLDSDQMAREFLMQFANMPFTKDQELVFEFAQQRRGQQDQHEKLPTIYTLKIFVKQMEGMTVNSKPQEV